MAAVLVAVVIAVATRGDGDTTEDAIDEVATAYRHTTAWAASTARPPMRALSGLPWVGTRVTTIDDDKPAAGADVPCHKRNEFGRHAHTLTVPQTCPVHSGIRV